MSRVLPAVVVAVAVVGLIACNSPLEPTSTSPPPTIHASVSLDDNPVVQSASGSAHLIGEAREVTRQFVMRKYADGTVDGWYHALRRGPGGAHIRVRIECLHVVGNEAWATGEIVDAINPNNIGLPFSFHMVDHGEGDESAPDEFGSAWGQYFDCETEPDLPMALLTIGNLQVRD